MKNLKKCETIHKLEGGIKNGIARQYFLYTNSIC